MSRRASNNVSLFPFLAVLVCAMGALILLLLVTTRRIRSDQLAALETEAAAERAAEPETEGPPPVILPEAVPLASEPDQVEFQPTVTPVEGPKVVDEIPLSVTDGGARIDYVERDRHALRGYDTMLDGRLRQAETNDRQLYEVYSRARTENQTLAKSDKQLTQQKASVQKSTADTKETERRLDAQLAALRRAIDEKEAQPVTAVSKFRIVPFDGFSGTIRRPIMIECVGDKFRFVPEGVEVTRDELEDFITTFNPLLSGASALNTHWAVKDNRSGTVGDPYILLIVRPSGSLGFYAARRMLRRLDTPVGYELLGENQILDLPAADPEATRICRLAVERTLARRGELAPLRPLAQSLRKQPASGSARSSQSRSVAGKSLEQTTDDRVRSFQRILAGMRTQNSQRPPGFESSTSFANRARMLSQGTSAEPGRVQPNDPNPMGQARLSGRSASQPRQITSNQGQGFTPGPSQRQAAQYPKGKQQFGSARLSASGAARPPGFSPPPLPPDPGFQNSARPSSQRPSAITDGSTKPVERQSPTPAQLNSFPGFQPTTSIAPQSSSAAQPSIKQPSNQPIPYRRAVDLFVDQNSVTVATNQRIRVDQSQVTGPWLGAILTQIEAEVRAWGDAPTGTTWSPEVRFRISPGATRTHTRIKNALSRLGMRTTDEMKVSPQSRTAAEVFRKPTQRSRTGGDQ